MSRTAQTFLVIVVTLILCLIFINFKVSQDSLAASGNPASFKEALLQYKGKNVEIGAIDNGGRIKVKLLEIEGDYIVTETLSGSSNSKLTYTSFLSINSFTKSSDGSVRIYTNGWGY